MSQIFVFENVSKIQVSWRNSHFFFLLLSRLLLCTFNDSMTTFEAHRQLVPVDWVVGAHGQLKRDVGYLTLRACRRVQDLGMAYNYSGTE